MKFGLLGVIAGISITGGIIAAISILNYSQPGVSSISDTSDEAQGRITRKLSFALFTVSNDNATLDALKNASTLFTQHDRGNMVYMIQSIRSLNNSISPTFDAFPNQEKIIVVQSLDNMTKAQLLATRFSDANTITYDIEHWSKTPQSEQSDVISSISKGADIAHSEGYRFGVTPDSQYLLENYKEIKWREIDFVGLQLQRYSNNVPLFKTYLNETSSFIRSENQNTKIFVQLSCRITSTEQTIEDIRIAKNYVDGIIFAYIPAEEGVAANHCTHSNLSKVVSAIATN
jgi:hypothetical protein